MAPAGSMAVFGGPGGAVVGGPPICPSLGGAGVAKGGFSSGISMKDPAFFVSVDGPSTAPALIPGVALGWVTGGPARLPLGGSSGAGSGGREAAAASAAASTNSLRDLGPGRGASDSRGPMRSGRQRWRKPVKPLMKALRVRSVSFFSADLGNTGGCSTFSSASWRDLARPRGSLQV